MSCRPPRSSSSSRSSRRTSCRAPSGFGRSARHTTRFRSSSTSPGGASAGWSRRTSPHCFEAIPHDRLMAGSRGTDRRSRVCSSSCARCCAPGCMEDGAVTRRAAGTPQGGVVSPAAVPTSTCTGWTGAGRTRDGVLVRYADDLVVMCTTAGRSRTRPAGADGAPGRPWPGAQAGQDADRAPARRR